MSFFHPEACVLVSAAYGRIKVMGRATLPEWTVLEALFGSFVGATWLPGATS